MRKREKRVKYLMQQFQNRALPCKMVCAKRSESCRSLFFPSLSIAMNICTLSHRTRARLLLKNVFSKTVVFTPYKKPLKTLNFISSWKYPLPSSQNKTRALKRERKRLKTTHTHTHTHRHTHRERERNGASLCRAIVIFLPVRYTRIYLNSVSYIFGFSLLIFWFDCVTPRLHLFLLLLLLLRNNHNRTSNSSGRKPPLQQQT